MMNAEAFVQNEQVPKVLIADDDPSIVRLLVGRCVKLGLRVESASNGLQALAVAQRFQPDVLVVDVNMPEVDGLSLCFHLLRPEARRLDVIVVTGQSDDETIARCDGFGAVYARKGPDLWQQVKKALFESFPRHLAGASEQTEAEDHVRDRPRVLVVDDDPSVGQFLGSRLRKLGVEPLLAKSGMTGYQLALRESPSVIVSDCFMPDGDIGYLIWRLRTTPMTERIPVIAMSGRPLDQSGRLGVLRGIHGLPGPAEFVSKSLDLRELFAALRKYCPLPGTN
ncbi:response regulator [uncultured Bradyrhizobium sp.]|uniref:response regulator n=1 Tax=uncultured Bradyrhizobium sp. TaxID=199684 RepID=UPI002627AFB3|nr:response regulator [uncultured Bradyrhizobium sp.]